MFFFFIYIINCVLFVYYYFLVTFFGIIGFYNLEFGWVRMGVGESNACDGIIEEKLRFV